MTVETHYFIYFISIVILLTRIKATEALIHRVSNYATCCQRCRDIAVHLKFNRDMTVILNCLPRPPSRRKCRRRKVSCQGCNRMARVGFKLRSLSLSHIDHNPGVLITRPRCRHYCTYILLYCFLKQLIRTRNASTSKFW